MFTSAFKGEKQYLLGIYRTVINLITFKYFDSFRDNLIMLMH